MRQNSINHLAIIMDGNGRWAKQKNQPRAFGHQTGAETAKKIINGQMFFIELEIYLTDTATFV